MNKADTGAYHLYDCAHYSCTAVILHYESPTYARWLSKFLDLASHSTDRYSSLDHVPFRFYSRSINAARAILDARAAADAAAEAEAVITAQALWDEHKLVPQGLPAAGPQLRHLANTDPLRDETTLLDVSPPPDMSRAEPKNSHDTH